MIISLPLAMASSSSRGQQSIYEPRRHVGILAERVTNVSSTDYPGHYPHEDNSWNLAKFKKNLRVQVQRLSNRSIDFDLVGVDACIANAFRRIMIAEVPSIAIEHVYVFNNTSIIVDEILAHRLGLIPLNVDPALMTMKDGPNDQPTDRNTLVFGLRLSCKRNTAAPKDSLVASQIYVNHELLSSHLQWRPQGEQGEVFASKPPAATNGNIVLAKLRPGQEIEMELHAIKGVGKDHAKFSPVATASYRLLPLIVLNPEKPVPPHLAEKFQKCFAPGVIRVDPRTKQVSVDEKNMRNDTVSREVLRHPEFADCVELKRVRDFFLFNVESEGPYAPERLLPEAIKVMREKIARIRKATEALLDEGNPLSSSGDVDVDMG